MLTINFENKNYIFDSSELEKFNEYIKLKKYFSQFEEHEILDIVVPKTIVKLESSVTHTRKEVNFEDKWRSMFKNDKPLTLQQNLYNIKSIKKILDIEEIKSEHFDDANSVIEKIWKKDVEDATKKNYLHVIMKIYKFYDAQYPKEYYDKVGEVKKQASIDHSFEATDKEKESLRYLRDNVDDIRESLKKDLGYSDFNQQKYVLFKLHVDFPCVRQDWQSVVITDEDINDDKTNYYNTTTGDVFLQSFKNKRNGMRVNMNNYKEVKVILDEWVEIRRKRINQVYDKAGLIPLFLSKTNKLLTKPTFCHLFPAIFGRKGISTNILRKFYISRFVTGNPNPEEILEINRIMCHSPKTCLTTYSKKF